MYPNYIYRNYMQSCPFHNKNGKKYPADFSAVRIFCGSPRLPFLYNRIRLQENVLFTYLLVY